MAKLKPYTLKECQSLVDDAIERYSWRHSWFKSLELLYKTGRSYPLSESTVAGTLFERLNPADLESINMVLPHLNIIIASVVARDPKPIAVPYMGGERAEVNAKVAENVASFWWGRTRATNILRDMAQDMVVLGNGFCKVGWATIANVTEKDDETYAQELTETVTAAEILSIQSGEEMEDIEYLSSFVSPEVVEIEIDEPFVTYVSPYDIFFPEEARRLEESRWIAQRVILPMDEVKANPEFKNKDSIVADGGYDYRDRYRDTDISYSEEQIYNTCTIYEFYDMRTRKLKVFQLNSDVALFEGDLPYSHRYSPFVHMRNYSDGGNEIWAFGDLENVAALQEKLNEVFTEQVDNMRRAGNKYIAAAGVFDAESRDRLESDEPDIVVEIEVPQGMGVGDMFAAVPRAPLPSDIYIAQGKFEEAMRQVLGINEFQAGGMGADRMSAYAAAVVDGVATLRGKDKQLSVEDAAAHVFNLLIRLCQEFMEDGQVIRLVGETGGVWEEIDSNSLYGEFDMKVEGGSLSSVNPATRQFRAMEMLNAVVPAIVNFGYDPEPALRHVVRDLGYDPDQFLIKAPPPEPEPAPADAGLPPELMAAMGAGAMPAEAALPPEALPPEAGLPPELLGLAGEAGLPVDMLGGELPIEGESLTSLEELNQIINETPPL
jgi:hypothetical protein